MTHLMRRADSHGCLDFQLEAGSPSSGIDCDPIDFPCLPTVVRKGLLEAVGVGRDFRDREANQYGMASEGILTKELTAAVLELSKHGSRQVAIRCVGIVERPLARFRLIESQRHTFD